MSHVEVVKETAFHVTEIVFTDNVVIKSIVSFFATIYSLIASGNETIIGMVILLYSIDLVLWVWKALHNKKFESRKFFMGATKLLVYGIFMVVAVSLGESLALGNLFLSWIFAFIIVTDSSSILENLEELWYKTPMALRKYLKVVEKQLEDKLKK